MFSDFALEIPKMFGKFSLEILRIRNHCWPEITRTVCTFGFEIPSCFVRASLEISRMMDALDIPRTFAFFE